MRKSLTGLVALSAVAAFGFTSAAPTDLLKDPLGDGNAINGQGFGDLTGQNPSQSTAPANANADLVNLQAATLFETVAGQDADGNATLENVVTGLQLRLGTAGEPTATDIPTITRIQTIIDGCTAWIQLYAGTNGADASNTGDIRMLGGCNLGTDATTGLDNELTVTGSWLAFTWDDETKQTVIDIDFAGLPAELAAYLDKDAYIDIQGAEVRFNSGRFTAPVIDEMLPDGWADFTVGDDVPPAS